MGQLDNKARANRTDLSDYVVHLTRPHDDMSALDSLLSILNSTEIWAAGHYNWFSPRLKAMGEDVCDLYNVVCLTEAPLGNLKHFIGVPNRAVRMAPYGVVFGKAKITEMNGGPVFYVHEQNEPLKDSLRKVFSMSGLGHSDLAPLLGLVNIVSSGHKFDWEREWRVFGDLGFQPNEVIAIICPESEHQELLSRLDWDSETPIVLIDLNWSESRIMGLIQKAGVYIAEIVLPRIRVCVEELEEACTCYNPEARPYYCFENLSGRFQLIEQTKIGLALAADVAENNKSRSPRVANALERMCRSASGDCSSDEVTDLVDFDWDDCVQRLFEPLVVMVDEEGVDDCAEEALEKAGEIQNGLVDKAEEPIRRLIDSLREVASLLVSLC